MANMLMASQYQLVIRDQEINQGCSYAFAAWAQAKMDSATKDAPLSDNWVTACNNIIASASGSQSEFCRRASLSPSLSAGLLSVVAMPIDDAKVDAAAVFTDSVIAKVVTAVFNVK